ncbi:MAG: response regulator [Akkermansiaceae bacterium]|nr:response regulator [Verrucomicrobiales bacterium]
MDKLLSGRRVLVIEDEMLILMMIEDMLADLGCDSVAVASKIGPAISLIEGQDFDTAMLDMNLDGIESYPIADALKAREVPYFFSTGNSLTNMKDGYRDQDVLKKPFTFEQLSNMLSRSLRASV